MSVLTLNMAPCIREGSDESRRLKICKQELAMELADGRGDRVLRVARVACCVLR